MRIDMTLDCSSSAIQRRAPADGTEDHHFNGRNNPDQRRGNEADLQHEQRASQSAQRRRKTKCGDLEHRNVVAGKAHAVLAVAHRQQHFSRLAGEQPLRRQDAQQQQDAGGEVKNVLRALTADVPAPHRAEIGDSVAATRVTLPAVNAERKDQRQCLGDDSEIDAAHAPLEHRQPDDERHQRRQGEDREQTEGQTLERNPKRRQMRDLIPIHEIRNAWRGLDFGADRVRRFELQEHRHAISAEAEENSLPKTEHAGFAPEHHQAERHESVGQIFANEIEAEGVQGNRQHDQQQQSQQAQIGQAARSSKNALVDVFHNFNTFEFQAARTLLGNKPFGRIIRTMTMVRRIATLPIVPSRKNSRMDWPCAMPKADAMVPSKLAVPPNTTTRNVSTMYREPLSGPVEPIVVKAAPATPAMPQPRQNVKRSTSLVLMPTAPLMVRFCTVARMCRPMRERNMKSHTQKVSSNVSPITNTPLIGISMLGVGLKEPINHSGSVGVTSRAPKVERNACCMMRLKPQVASSVSSGRL